MSKEFSSKLEKAHIDQIWNKLSSKWDNNDKDKEAFILTCLLELHYLVTVLQMEGWFAL